MNLITGNLITLFPLALVIFLVLFDTIANNKPTKYFLYAVSITAIESILEIITVVNTANTFNAAVVSAIANSLGFSLASFVGYFMLLIVIDKTPLEKYRKLLKLPLIFNIMFSLSSIWTGLVFMVTPDNNYSRGPLFMVQFIVNICYILLFIIISFSEKKKRKQLLDDKVCFWVNCLLVIAGIFLQVLYPNILLIWVSVSIYMVFCYITTLNIQLKRDPLTNVFNRRTYQNNLNRLNGKQAATIINIDINNFKTINDTFGHAFGDEVLIVTSEALQNSFENFGYTYRIGGDEFSILTNNHLPSEAIYEIFLSIETTLHPLKERLKFTTLFSYGHYNYDPKTCDDIHEAEKYADQLMYTHKNEFKAKMITRPSEILQSTVI